MITLERAIEIAVSAHEGQKDRAGKPYILHCLRVMLSDYNHSEKFMKVAVLHDLLEDTPWTAEKLKEEGVEDDEIEALIALTRLENETYEEFIDRVSENDLASSVKIKDICDHFLPNRCATIPPEKYKSYNMAMEKLIYRTSNMKKVIQVKNDLDPLSLRQEDQVVGERGG